MEHPALLVRIEPFEDLLIEEALYAKAPDQGTTDPVARGAWAIEALADEIERLTRACTERLTIRCEVDGIEAMGIADHAVVGKRITTEAQDWTRHNAHGAFKTIIAYEMKMALEAEVMRQAARPHVRIGAEAVIFDIETRNGERARCRRTRARIARESNEQSTKVLTERALLGLERTARGTTATTTKTIAFGLAQAKTAWKTAP